MVSQLLWKTSPPPIDIRPLTHISTPSYPKINVNAHHLSPRTAQPSPPVQTAISLAGLDTGTKVGIIIGITVIAILILIGFGLGILSCRNLRNKRKERDRERNGEEMSLELETKDGMERRKDCKPIGLWDNLRIGGGDGNVEGEQRNTRVRDARGGFSQESANVGRESR